MNGNPKSALNLVRAYRSIYSRFPAILLLFSAIPLAVNLYFHAPIQIFAYHADCQPSMQNTFPSNVASGQEIVITTTITNVCLTTLDYTQIIVDIRLPNSAVILSSSAANPVAVNKIRTPQVGGRWTVDVVVSFNDYPIGGTLSSFQNAIIINVIGPLASSSTKSSTVSSPIVTSAVHTTKSTTSSQLSVLSTMPPQLLSTSSTSTTNSSSSTSLTPLSVQYLWQGWNGMIILVSVLMILIGVFFVRIRRRKSE